MDKETKEFVEACEARATKATPGPWETCGASDNKCRCGLIWSIPEDMPPFTAHAADDDAGAFFTHEQRCANAEFVAHAREDLPRALRIIREQAAEIQRLRKAEFDRLLSEPAVVWGMK